MLLERSKVGYEPNKTDAPRMPSSPLSAMRGPVKPGAKWLVLRGGQGAGWYTNGTRGGGGTGTVGGIKVGIGKE